MIDLHSAHKALLKLHREKEGEKASVKRSHQEPHEKRLQTMALEEQQQALSFASHLITQMMPEQFKAGERNKSDINIKDEHLTRLRCE